MSGPSLCHETVAEAAHCRDTTTLSATSVGYKRIGIGMPVVDREILPRRLLPHGWVYGREECVGIGKTVVYLGNIEAACIVYGSPVKRCSADDKKFLLIGLSGQRFGQRRISLDRLGQPLGVRREYHILAPGQRSCRKRLKGTTPHNNGMTKRQRLEMFQVVGQMTQQVIILTNGSIGSHSGNQREIFHKRKDYTETTPLI